MKKKSSVTFCSCGCRERMPKYTISGERRNFLRGHHTRKNFLSKRYLKQLYSEENKAVSEIAKMVHASESSISRQLKFWKIKIKTRSESHTHKKKVNAWVKCPCGCGKSFRKYSKRGDARKFASRHCSRTKRIRVKCAWCSKEEDVLPSSLKGKKRHFCGCKCLAEWQRENWQRENHPAWKREKRKCAYCGKIIFKSRYAVKLFKLSFCNSECKGKWQKENLKSERNPSWRGGPKKVNCAVCGEEFPIKLYRYKARGKHFCSHECASIAMIGEGSACWIDGRSYEPYPPEFNEIFKEKIRTFDNYKCQKCGAPQSEFKKTLPVHHINYNKKDNRIENCVTLCKYCNGEVNTDREFWQIYFQTLRRERLKELKK